MATSDILGLFTTPEQYQLAQRQAQEAEALQYAKLDPMSQAQYGFYRAGQQLGGAIGGALGGQDPMLQKISQRQQLIGMIDPSNPDSYAQAIQVALQGGDQEAAFLLRNEMMKVQEQAQQQQLNQLKTQDYLTERGIGMQNRGLQANALELSKGLIKADGTVDETVYNELLGYGQIGSTIIDQRLKATQGLETQQIQNLAKGLINPDGTRNKEVEQKLSTTVAGRAILKQFAPETKVFKRGDIITEVNPVTGDYDIVTPKGLKAVPAGANPIKAMIDTKAIDPTVTPFAQEIASQWDNLDDKGRSDSLESLTKVNNQALDRNQRKAEAGAGGTDKVQSSKVTPDGTTIVVMKNGTTRVISAEGVELKGQERATAIRNSEEFGADVQANRAQARGIAELSSKQVGQAFAEVGKIKKNIGNIDEAIAAIDAGASTGVIASKLPNITAASIQLANVRQQLGLDVIGSVTFGALSEGELNLALDTALPTGLAPKELRTYLVNKKTAQTKLSGYLTEQATYLSKRGNTLSGWLEKVENKGTPISSESAVNQIPSGRQQPSPSARTQPAPQGKVVKKWSDL
jgi:hypothetical protein